MNKKAFSVIAVVMVLSLILTACGGGRSTAEPEKDLSIRRFCTLPINGSMG